jgi:hypothetical protein
VLNHSREGFKKKILIILRFEDRASQIINIRRVNLKIEIIDPIEEMIFQVR